MIFSFIGEESVSAGKKSILTDNPTWIIDPIDGTTNFVHRSDRNRKIHLSYLLNELHPFMILTPPPPPKRMEQKIIFNYLSFTQGIIVANVFQGVPFSCKKN